MRKTIIIPLGKLITCLIGLAIVVTLVSRFWRNNTFVFFVLLAFTAAIFLRPRRSKRDLVPLLVGGILGPLMEMIVIRYGGWQYANPSFGGIPMWLPLLWGITGWFLYKITDLLMPREHLH